MAALIGLLFVMGYCCVLLVAWDVGLLRFTC